MLSVVYGLAIEAEKARGRPSAARVRSNVLVSLPWVEALAKALGAIAAGDLEAGVAGRDEAFDQAGTRPAAGRRSRS